MRTITRRPSHAVTETRRRRSQADGRHPSQPRLRPQLVSDAVIAGYIHDISARHHAGADRRRRLTDERLDTRQPAS